MSKEYTRRQALIGLAPIGGPVVLYDDFSGTLKWTKTDGAGDSIFELDPGVAYVGDQSLYIKPRTTAAAENDAISATRYVPLTPSLKLTMTCFIRPSANGTTMKYFSLGFLRTIPNVQWKGSVRYDAPNDIFQYQDIAEAWQDITGSDLLYTQDKFHRFSMSLDFLNNEYLSFSFNENFHNLAGLALAESANINTQTIASVEVVKGSIGVPSAHVDSMLITEL